MFTKLLVNNRGTDGGRAMTTIESVERRSPTTHPPIVALDDPRAANAQVSGAKAAALAKAAANSLPVLAGMVVTTDAFTRPVADVEDDLRTAWARISDFGRQPIVVRSSSTIEDNANSSMAGMFTSVLDVTSWDGFRLALDTVLASSNVVALTGPAARSRVRAPMAVLVQPQLTATVGGVLFGLDPVSGRRDRLVVSASEAGPSAVVSGEVDGTRYVLSRHGRRLEGQTGTAGPLTPFQLRRLAALARQAEHVFGGPQDVEWAFGPDGRLWLLQSRPITAAAADALDAHGPVLGPGPVAETFPDALSALEEDLWVGPLRDGLRTALSLAGTAPKRRLATSPVVTTAGGRVAADLELLGATDAPTSFLRRLDPRPPARRLVAAWRVGRLRAALPALADDLLTVADRDLLDVPDLATLSDRELISLLGRAGTALASLHGHEVLMGWLVTSTSSSTTAASVALRALASARADGMSDDDIVATYPGVLALVPPRIGSVTVLPPTVDGLGVAHEADPGSDGPEPDRPAVLREALRLRARWVQELTAKAAEQLGRRLADKGVLAQAAHVRHLRLEELATAVHRGRLPDDVDIEERAHITEGAPLPTRFRLTNTATVVPVAGRARRSRRFGGREGVGAGAGAGTGAGGGRGMGPVHIGDDPPAVGSVLVVRTLDPGLASVLPRLGGLVAETGSFLSHLAILAREARYPNRGRRRGRPHPVPGGDGGGGRRYDRRGQPPHREDEHREDEHREREQPRKGCGMKAGRIASLFGVVVMAATALYFFVYLWRWEWNRALIAGMLFVAAEVAMLAVAVLDRIRRLSDHVDRRFDAQSDGRVLSRIRESAPPARDHFQWLSPASGRTNVFVPVLMGMGVVMSALAWLVERLARATAAPSMERGLASRMSALAWPAEGLLVPIAVDEPSELLARPVRRELRP